MGLYNKKDDRGYVDPIKTDDLIDGIKSYLIGEGFIVKDILVDIVDKIDGGLWNYILTILTNINDTLIKTSNENKR